MVIHPWSGPLSPVLRFIRAPPSPGLTSQSTAYPHWEWGLIPGLPKIETNGVDGTNSIHTSLQNLGGTLGNLNFVLWPCCPFRLGSWSRMVGTLEDGWCLFGFWNTTRPCFRTKKQVDLSHLQQMYLSRSTFFTTTSNRANFHPPT